MFHRGVKQGARQFLVRRQVNKPVLKASQILGSMYKCGRETQHDGIISVLPIVQKPRAQSPRIAGVSRVRPGKVNDILNSYCPTERTLYQVIVESAGWLAAHHSVFVLIAVLPDRRIRPAVRTPRTHVTKIGIQRLKDRLMHGHGLHHLVDNGILGLDAEMGLQFLIPGDMDAAVHRAAQVKRYSVRLLVAERLDNPFPMT